MSAIKSIYNSTTLECVLELLWLTLGVRLDPNFVTYQLTNLDGLRGKLIATARGNAADGRSAVYAGAAEFPYDKMDINAILPTDLVYGDTYPMTFDRLRTYLANSYDYALEEGEFSQVGDVTQRPLVSGDTLSVAPDANKNIFLKTTAQAGRWKVGSTIRIHLTGYTP